MKALILQLIADKPKHYAKIIFNNPVFKDWVVSNADIETDNKAELVYSAVYQTSNICVNNKIKKFKSINDGYIGCGKANICECVAAAVSVNVSRTKQTQTPAEKLNSTNKKRATNLAKYGHINAAQSISVKEKHKEFYLDPVKVSAMLVKVKETYNTKYGVDNCRQLPESEAARLATILSKYNVVNISQIPSTKAKLSARMADYKATGYLLEKGLLRFTNYISTKYNFTLLNSLVEYKEIKSSPKEIYTFKCNTCQTEVSRTFNYGRGLSCAICNPLVPKFVSAEEQEVYDFVTHSLMVVNGIQGVKSIIAPYELDMVFPDQKIAIEYCGLYWHSEASSHKNQKYHANKLRLANEQGYRLITIFSDEWNTRKAIVKSKLTNIFCKTSVVHYARKLTVKLVNGSSSKTFLNNHHLQGSSSAKINLGLYTANSELVALMTFSSGRKALNTKPVDGEFELVRYVTNGSSVVGGASKLLSFFKKTYHPSRITSFADLRWSEGNVYKKLGFTLAPAAPTIGYWYVDNYDTRLHRYNFTKYKLVSEGADISLTEWEIMRQLGYDRIWDCGHQKWILTC